MKRLSMTLIVLALLLFSTALVPMGSDASLTIKDDGPMEKEVIGGDTTTFSWFIYNRHSEDVFISASLELDDPDDSVKSHTIRVVKDGKHETSSILFLQPNQSARLEVSIAIKDLAPSSKVGIELHLETDVGVDDSNITTTVLDASLDVVPTFTLSQNYNRILGVFPNFLPEPADGPLGAFLVSMAIWISMGALFMWWIVPGFSRRILNRDERYCPQIKSLLNRPIFYLVVAFGLFSSLFILGPDYYLALLLDTVSRVIYIILIAWIVWSLYKILVDMFMERFRDEHGVLDPSLGPLFIWLGKLVLAVALFGAILDVFGFDLMVFLAGAGIIGIALAIGAQDTFSNFFAGFFLLVERPFRVGDLIMMDDGVICEVKRVGLRSTTLYNTWDPQYFVLPNRRIADSKITNVLRPDPKYWVKINVGVAYGSDIELVKRILLDVVMSHPETMKDEEHLPWSRFMAFGDSSLEFRVTAWVPDFTIHYRVSSELREAIDKEFRKHGVQIPFPQRDVWFRNKPS